MKSKASATAGFTLVEVLVAFVMLALLAIAVDRAVVASVEGSARADERVQSEMVARMLISGPLGLGPDAVKPKRGRMNGLSWSLRFEPVNLPVRTSANMQAQAVWVPMRMIVTVSGKSNANGMTVATVRLVNMAVQ